MAAKETATNGRRGHAHRNSGDVGSLLRELTNDEVQRKAAQDDLDLAIVDFKELDANLREPRRAGDRRDVAPRRRRVTDTRSALAKLDAALKATSRALRSLPLPARTLFLRGWKAIDAPSPAKLGVILDAAEVATYLARGAASKLPDKSPNYAVQILAYDVAKTLKNRLHINPTMTRDDDVATGARGGAAYARLLRAAMDQAGAPHVEDLSAIMRSGLDLLADPTLPTRD